MNEIDKIKMCAMCNYKKENKSLVRENELLNEELQEKSIALRDKTKRIGSEFINTIKYRRSNAETIKDIVTNIMDMKKNGFWNDRYMVIVTGKLLIKLYRCLELTNGLFPFHSQYSGDIKDTGSVLFFENGPNIVMDKFVFLRPTIYEFVCVALELRRIISIYKYKYFAFNFSIEEIANNNRIKLVYGGCW